MTLRKRYSQKLALSILVSTLVLSPHLSSLTQASAGPLGIDYRWPRSDTGIWRRDNQFVLQYVTVGTGLAGALWFGNDTQLGRTFFQALDASAISAIAVHSLKLTTGRSRPIKHNNPNEWFIDYFCNRSFPSAEVTLQASFITPFIVSYIKEKPWILALEILPLYVGIARMKSQAHWQTDVLAGWLLGTAIGYYCTKSHRPLIVSLLPTGLSVGFYKKF